MTFWRSEHGGAKRSEGRPIGRAAHSGRGGGVVWRSSSRSGGLGLDAPRSGGFYAVALACDSNDLGVVQEAVQNRPGGGHILEQFAPVLV